MDLPGLLWGQQGRGLRIFLEVTNNAWHGDLAIVGNKCYVLSLSQNTFFFLYLTHNYVL